MGEVNDDDLVKKLADEYYQHMGILEDLGKEALKKALTDHFTAEIQDNPDDKVSVSDLVKFHLSRHNLKSNFKQLYSDGLIQVRKIQPGDDEIMGSEGFPIIVLSKYAIVIGISSFKNVDVKIWERTFEKVFPKGQGKASISSPTPFEVLEEITGFEVNMHKFALHVAALMYIASLRDDVMFWKGYKPYMRVLPTSEFQTLKKESEDFDKKMTFVVGAYPRFMGCVTILTE